MQNTTNINIGGRIISIHDNAWKMKRVYIETLYNYFINEKGSFEIINDIECRIAELMQEIINSRTGPINEIDIENIIRIMGTVAQFSELDTDDWDTITTSSEHYTINSSGTIESSYNFKKIPLLIQGN